MSRFRPGSSVAGCRASPAAGPRDGGGWGRAWICATLLLSWGCERDTEQLAGLRRAAEPRLSEFAKFDRWARRALHGSEPRAQPEVLREALFAPVRNDSDVQLAWVQGEKRIDGPLVFPSSAAVPALPEGAVQLRDPSLGPLHVIARRRCQLELPRGWRSGVPEGCVILARSAAERGFGEVVVGVVFASGSELQAAP